MGASFNWFGMWRTLHFCDLALFIWYFPEFQFDSSGIRSIIWWEFEIYWEPRDLCSFWTSSYLFEISLNHWFDSGRIRLVQDTLHIASVSNSFQHEMTTHKRAISADPIKYLGRVSIIWHNKCSQENKLGWHTFHTAFELSACMWTV